MMGKMSENLIDSIDPIGAPFDPSTPNTEVPTSITCNPDRSPRDRSIRDMVNKEDAFHDEYDSDGKTGPFINRIDKEGQQLLARSGWMLLDIGNI
jgi:hypothetical protein